MNIEKIKAVALAATQGEWITGDIRGTTLTEVKTVDNYWIASVRRKETADFIATANPSAVLELIDRLEAAEKIDANVLISLSDEVGEQAETISELQTKLEAAERDAARYQYVHHLLTNGVQITGLSVWGNTNEVNRRIDSRIAAMKEKP